tara:strand:- start:2773 stop:3081 length:309 start_codon:yes stop_codon:yes gene_type:complete
MNEQEKEFRKDLKDLMKKHEVENEVLKDLKDLMKKYDAEKEFRKDLKALLKKHGVEISREDSGDGVYHSDYEINYYQPSKWEDGVLVREGFDFTENYMDGEE